jgi:enamine deaminase RidA (YjgF/YER057c/UK114 family)
LIHSLDPPSRKIRRPKPIAATLWHSRLTTPWELLELYGPEIGAHARSAVGMAELPFNTAVEIEAEVEVEVEIES